MASVVAVCVAVAGPAGATPLPTVHTEVCYDVNDPTLPVECAPAEPTQPPADEPTEPPSDPTPEQTPPEVVDESPNLGSSTDNESAVVPPPPVVVVTPPAPTPTPTRTAEPAPAGWDAPLYPDNFVSGANQVALIALFLSLAASALFLAVLLLQRGLRQTAGRRKKPTTRPEFVTEEEARATLLPATAAEFTEFDHAILGYDGERNSPPTA